MQAQSPYSASKIAADQISIAYNNSFNTPVTIVRPFNAYGPRQSERAIIPTIISQIITKKKFIEIGNPFPNRDDNYVDDIADAFLKILSTNKTINEVLTFAQEGNSNLKLAEKILKITKSKKLFQNLMNKTKKI